MHSIKSTKKPILINIFFTSLYRPVLTVLHVLKKIIITGKGCTLDSMNTDTLKKLA